MRLNSIWGDQVVAEYWNHEVDRVVYEELPPTTGTANAIINNVETPVKWVQLWRNGPKFAEYNVGATSATEYGGYYEWNATTPWGGNWRIPTNAEFEALLKNSTCTWTTKNKVNGLLCRGKEGTVFESNSVFLPAAGDCYNGDVYNQGYYGHYWSSMLNDSKYAFSLYFDSVRQSVSINDRFFGYSVRAVLAE